MRLLPDDWADALERHPVRKTFYAVVTVAGTCATFGEHVPWVQDRVPVVTGSAALGTFVAGGVTGLVLARRRSSVPPGPPPPPHPERVPAAVSGVRLPRATGRLCGRDAELAQVRALFAQARLVTLTGPGGTGKTALALAAARLLGDELGAAALVELQPLEGGRQELADDVARALLLPEVPGAERLAALVGETSCLLVLDNCEHVLPAVRQLLEVLLDRCPGLRVLATSRQPLALVDEHVLPLAPLQVPEHDDDPNAVDSSAVALFLEHAHRKTPTFSASGDELAAVVRVCRRLDGLPLAIVVAAAQVSRLDVHELERDLDRCLGWQTPHQVGRGDAQRTLRATVEWSYGLLTPSARELFTRLSVFAGTVSRPGAAALGGADAEEALDELLDHSLLAPVSSATGTRYRMMEVVRRYAADRLRGAGGGDEARDLHLRFLVRVVRAAAPELLGPQREQRLDELDDERDDARAALEWALNRPGVHDDGQRLAAALFWYWNFTGRWTEARLWLERAREWRPTASADLVRVVHGLGVCLFMQGVPAARDTLEEALGLVRGLHGAPDVDEHERRSLLAQVLTVLAITRIGPSPETAVDAARESVRVFDELGHAWGRALALNDLGRVLFSVGQREESDEALASSLREWRRVGDAWGTALVLTTWANTTCERGNTDTARTYIQEAHALQVRSDDVWGQANSHFVLGAVAVHEGDLATGRDEYVRSLVLNLALGRSAVAGAALVRLACIAVRTGDDEAACLLVSACDALYARTGASLPSRDQGRLREVREVVARLHPLRRDALEVEAAGLDARGTAAVAARLRVTALALAAQR